MLNILDIETNESVIFFFFEFIQMVKYKHVMNFKNSVKLITDWNIVLPVLSSVVKIKLQLT